VKTPFNKVFVFVDTSPVCSVSPSSLLHLSGAGANSLTGCPYEGTVSNETTLSIVREFLSMGCYEVSLGDTIGAGTPHSTDALLSLLSSRGIPLDRISMHFHDTHSHALSNILVALSHGIIHIDSSVSGLGGCPYAGGGSGGNVATEDVVWLLHSLGIESHVKMKPLLRARSFIDRLLRRETRAKVPCEELERLETDEDKAEASDSGAESEDLGTEPVKEM
jgi:hydroxymethylglutaryl-CoA lyase